MRPTLVGHRCLPIGLAHGARAVVVPLLLAVASVASAQAARPPLTFSKDIAPILFRHCASCHQPDASAPFSVLTFSEVRPRATSIAAAVSSRQMPPWKPESGYGEFVGTRRLADDDIDRIVQWVRDGALEGNPADLPPLPAANQGWQLGAPDLIVRLPAYELAPNGRDRYRNFVVSVPGDHLRFVRGLEFHPNSAAVHHANIFVDSTDTSRQLDALDPLPGYEGVVPYAAAFPDGHFLGWTPGQIAPLEPEAQAWRLPRGSSLLVQMHVMPGERAQVVEPTIGLYFTRTAPTQMPVMLRLGRQNLDIQAGDPAYLTEDSYTLPVDAQIQAVQPHAHHRASEVKAWATLPDGARRWLIYISRWDFGWQDQYRYSEPFWLPAGTTVTVQYTFNNSAANRRNPDDPPRRVVWGQRSSDEMADLWVQMLTRTEADLTVLSAQLRRKMILEDIAGHEVELRTSPDSTIIHDDVAVLYLEAGRPVQAAAHFAAVSRLRPESAAARFNLGTALQQSGRVADAADQYAEAVRLDPSYSRALKALANALLITGRMSDAAGRFREVLARDPRDAESHNNLGFCAFLEGDLESATRSFETALALQPSYADAHFNLARVLIRRGQAVAAETHLRHALRSRSDWAPAMSELAWVLAHAPSSAVRVQEAVRTAERAIELAGRTADVMLSLAASYAAGGRFNAALSVLDEASTSPDLSADARATMARQIDAYRSKRVLIDSRR